MEKKSLSDKEQYNQLAVEFQEKDKKFVDATRNILRSRIHRKSLPGKKILDVGCGYGKDLKFYSQFNCKTFGIDSSKEIVKLARKTSPKSNILCADFEESFFVHEKFDYIVSRYALQHAQNVKKVLLNMKNILADEGEIIFVVTHPFRQYFEKKTKNYWKQEVVFAKVFNNTITLQEPSHRLEEYLDAPFLAGLQLIYMQEIFDPAAEPIKNAGTYPCALLLHFKHISELKNIAMVD
jgi:2-polyprenyl-3-methyl-5-hydroxy-6-metoxy-1,4-benzoquinol methylase